LRPARVEHQNIRTSSAKLHCLANTMENQILSDCSAWVSPDAPRATRTPRRELRLISLAHDEFLARLTLKNPLVE